MKFVFCTEPIYQYYRNNLYDNTQDILDRKSIIEGGYDDIKDQLSKLDENIYSVHLTSADYPRNPWNQIGQLVKKLTLNYLIEDPLFDEAFAEIIFNQSEEEFFEFFDLIYKFYNGKEVFVIVGEDDFSDMVNQMVCRVIRKAYGIQPSIVYDLDDVMNLRDDINFSQEGARAFHIQLPKYFELLGRREREYLNIWYPFDMTNYTNAFG